MLEWPDYFFLILFVVIVLIFWNSGNDDKGRKNSGDGT